MLGNVILYSVSSRSKEILWRYSWSSLSDYRQGMGVGFSLSRVASTSASSGEDSSLFPCSSVCSLPWDTQTINFFNTGSSHGLLFFMNYYSIGPFQGAALQQKAAPEWVPHGVTSPATNLLQHGVLSSQGQDPVRSLLQHGLPMGSQPASGTSPCSGVESSMGCRW